MFRKLSVFLFALLLLILPTLTIAQDTPTPIPRFKEPSADDYIAQVRQIIWMAQTSYTEVPFDGQLVASAEVAAIFDEVTWRYLNDDELNYEQMSRLFQSLPIEESLGWNFNLNWLYLEASTDWFPALVERWLTEHPYGSIIDGISQIYFDNIDLIITPIKGGYFIDFIRNDINMHRRYIAVSNPDYEWVIPSLPVSIDSNLLASGDFNSDGMPDFAYLSDYTIENTVNIGSVVIVSWTGEEFEILTSLQYGQAPYVMNYSWQFLNVDEDPQIEVIQNQLTYDRFDCNSIHITSFDWDDEQQLKPNTEEVLLPAGFHCLLRKAEEAVWGGDYAAGIESYQQALTFPTEDVKRLEFAQMRLALAYLFTGDVVKADQIFNALTPDEGSLAEIAQQTYQVDHRPLAVCQALYNWLFEGNHRSSLYEISLGTLDEVDGGFYGRPSPNGPGVDPANTACDLPAWIRNAVADTAFPVTESPLEKLEALGLKLGGAGSADFNQDGDEEWLVWVDSIGLSSILFVPGDDFYTLSASPNAENVLEPSASLRPPNQYNQYSVITLPDELGKAVVNIDFADDRYSPILCVFCGGGPVVRCPQYDRSLPRSSGSLTMYRMESGQFVRFFSAPVCSLQRIDQRVISGDVINGLEGFTAGYVFVEKYADANSVVYQ